MFVCDIPPMAKVVKVRENRWEFWCLRLQMFVSTMVKEWYRQVTNVMTEQEYSTIEDTQKHKYIQTHVPSQKMFRNELMNKRPELEKEIAMAINARIDHIEYGSHALRPGELVYTIDIYTHLWEFLSMVCLSHDKEIMSMFPEGTCNQIVTTNLPNLITTYIVFH